VKLAGVADTDISRARESGVPYGAETFSDFREMLGQVDAVSIVTPTETHHEIALHCLSCGKDVLVEKPVATSLREADSLMNETARKNLIMQVGHIERFNPVTERCFSMIEEVSSIEAERVSPFEGRAADVDVTLDLMIHDIDIALAALGSPRVRKMWSASSRVSVCVCCRSSCVPACTVSAWSRSLPLNVTLVATSCRAPLEVL
jgi:predicted dehydrogenase